MAVYTEIGDDELRRFTALDDIGAVASWKGTTEGIENSNLLPTTGYLKRLRFHRGINRPARHGIG